MTFTCHSSFNDALISRYDGFILDQFGVLHNGKNGLAGASDCVRELHARGKRLIILSNTSSPSTAALNKLPRLGFDASHFRGAVTSGEEAGRYLRETYGSKGEKEKVKTLWITWAGGHDPPPTDFLDKCGDGIELVGADDVASAELVIAHGSGAVRGPDGDETSLGAFHDDGDVDGVLRPLLEACRKNNVPMVCANPDLVTVRPGDPSKVFHMPGAYAKLYEEELGGQVLWFGKPHREHFEACLRELDLPRDRVVHVGDSLHHDIKGAVDSNIDSVFVVGGVHRDALLVDGASETDLPASDRLASLFRSEGDLVPTHVVPMFRL